MTANQVTNDTEVVEITRADLRKVFWRSLSIMASLNYERFLAVGRTYIMLPVLRKLYKGDELKKVLHRYLEFFLTHPYFANPIAGIQIAMEEERAKGAPIDEDAIRGVATGLMGPLAGVGDPLFWGTIRSIIGGLCASLALAGNAIAPFLFLILWNIPHYFVRGTLLYKGYDMGLGLVREFRESGIMQRITEGASIMGMTAIGALIALWVRVDFSPLAFNLGDAAFNVQELLDSIFPNMLPLGLTLLLASLLAKKFNVNLLILILIGIGLLAAFLGIMG
jgi:mannose/fructose/sorbose-specific phosphotransferase system IID component